MSRGDLGRRARAAHRWLLDRAFPLWSSAGFDPASGQFVEELNLAGDPHAAVPRRSLVQARQMYVFSLAGRMGWGGPWQAVMEAAADTLLARGRTDEGDWVFSFDAEGRPLDTRRDLYTQAFMIFGLTHAGAVLQRDDLLAAARETRDRLDRAWRSPAGGFVEGDLFPGIRRQNPHMHLMEAALALHARDGATEFTDELVALFKARFADDGGVREHFDLDLAPLSGARGRIREPGHAFEWTWLIERWATIKGIDESTTTDRLYAAGMRGLHPAGMACDELWADGSVKAATARTWPQCEWLKAALSRLARTNSAGDIADACSAHQALSCYLDVDQAGGWRDRRLADGGWGPGPMPASTAYHIAGALDALIRQVDAMQAAPSV